MAQSLSKLLVHLIYSTKHREPLLKEPAIREELHRYSATILKSLDSPAILINSVEDHIHLLFVLSKKHSLSAIVEETKTASSKWIKGKGHRYANFHWQNGYGAFSVSQSIVADVQQYVAGQEEHHRKRTFQEEFREFLTRYEVAFDERYVWD